MFVSFDYYPFLFYGKDLFDHKEVPTGQDLFGPGASVIWRFEATCVLDVNFLGNGVSTGPTS